MDEPSKDPQKKAETPQESFYRTATKFFSGGTYDNILLGLLAGLNENLRKTDKSSTKLARSLNIVMTTGKAGSLGKAPRRG